MSGPVTMFPAVAQDLHMMHGAMTKVPRGGAESAAVEK